MKNTGFWSRIQFLGIVFIFILSGSANAFEDLFPSFSEKENLASESKGAKKSYFLNLEIEKVWQNLDEEKPLGRIKNYDGSSLDLSWEDLVWMARMVYSEGAAQNREHAAVVIWSTVTRACILPKFKGKPLKELFLAFSQPINPKWSRDGVFCRPGGKYHEDKSCSEKRLSARDRHKIRKWNEIPVLVRKAVLDFAFGQLENPLPSAMNFAAEYIKRNSDSEPLVKTIDGNSFYASNGKRIVSTLDWNGSEIVVHSPEWLLEGENE